LREKEALVLVILHSNINKEHDGLYLF